MAVIPIISSCLSISAGWIVTISSTFELYSIDADLKCLNTYNLNRLFAYKNYVEFVIYGNIKSLFTYAFYGSRLPLKYSFLPSLFSWLATILFKGMAIN